MAVCLQLKSMELVKQEGNDSLDMLIRRAVGKDPFLTFHRPENSPVQLFQLLNTLERPGNCLVVSLIWLDLTFLIIDRYVWLLGMVHLYSVWLFYLVDRMAVTGSFEDTAAQVWQVHQGVLLSC